MVTGVPLETGRTPHLSKLQGFGSEQPMKQQQTVEPGCHVDVPHQCG